jgi:hypothetical protein
MFDEGMLKALQKVHHDTPLTELYKGREFPASDTYSIGGHESELGHININFFQNKKKIVYRCYLGLPMKFFKN